MDDVLFTVSWFMHLKSGSWLKVYVYPLFYLFHAPPGNNIPEHTNMSLKQTIKIMNSRNAGFLIEFMFGKLGCTTQCIGNDGMNELQIIRFV